MMPLIFAKEGETVTIRRISGKDDVRQHLAELGFVMDAEVLIVSHMAGGRAGGEAVPYGFRKHGRC